MAKPSPEKVAERFAWITRAGLFLLLVAVCARCGLAEMLRDPMPVLPGSTSPPRGPGPAAGIALDLLLWVPGLLVLLRRILDREHQVRLPWSLGALAMLGVWALASTLWAADKFAALVNAFHLIGAAGAMFAAVQLVRGWREVRLVAGVAVGVMLMLLAQGVNKRLVETPETIRQWNDPSPHNPNSRWQYMRDHGLMESDFQFIQTEKKILGGELTGFSASANTYAAMIAVGLVVMFGMVAQGLSNGRKWWWAVALVVVLVAVFVLRYTHSRQAAITPVLGMSALLLIRWKGAWLAAKTTYVYWIGVGVFVLGAVALVGHGMYHGSLGDRSLTFRWYYWVGAARLVAERPLAGVGWGNFGRYYPAVRVAQATEEVQDPHNILVRAFVELGIVGGVLLMAWLMRLFWEMTRPGGLVDAIAEEPRRDACVTKGISSPLPWAVGLAAATAVVNLLAGHDFSQGAAWFILQAIYSLGAAVLLALGILAVTGVLVAEKGSVVRVQGPATAGNEWTLKWDDTSGQWVLRGLAAAAGIFFVHNLIDFSWSEPAPMCLFMLLAGAAVGARRAEGAPARPQWVVVTMGAVAAALWLGALVCVWGPVYVAEDRAAMADARVRDASHSSPFAIRAAADGYAAAFETMPLNADYRMREARVRELLNDRTNAALACEQAIRTNPRETKYHLLRAELEQRRDKPDPAIVKRAMESAIALDPRQVSLHIDYGDALLRLGEKETARHEYARALALDDELPEKEPKRMALAKRKEIERKAAE